MKGGTLIVTRAVNHHQYYKSYLEGIGFKNVYITDVDKNGLNLLIRERKPDLIMIEACFYRKSTPYMMRQLLEDFPELNIVAVNMYDYADEDAMLFIFNGVNSYVNLFEGVPEFRKGIAKILKGVKYISPAVQYKISLLKEMPDPVDLITLRQNEVLQLTCRGNEDTDIANNLNISIRTVRKHKENLYKSLNVNNQNELFWAARDSGLVKTDGAFFYPVEIQNSELKKMKIRRKVC